MPDNENKKQPTERKGRNQIHSATPRKRKNLPGQDSNSYRYHWCRVSLGLNIVKLFYHLLAYVEITCSLHVDFSHYIAEIQSFHSNSHKIY
jgi:hypothetical protein